MPFLRRPMCPLDRTWSTRINLRTAMSKFSITGLLIVLLFGVSGCFYLDNPPVRTIAGQVVRKDTDQPVRNADIYFRSGRRFFSLIPVDTFGIDAATVTDQRGRFSISARLNDKVEVFVLGDEFLETFALPAFPPSNQLLSQYWRLSHRKPAIVIRHPETNK
jgi:hypothetical protein